MGRGRLGPVRAKSRGRKTRGGRIPCGLAGAAPHFRFSVDRAGRLSGRPKADQARAPKGNRKYYITSVRLLNRPLWEGRANSRASSARKSSTGTPIPIIPSLLSPYPGVSLLLQTSHARRVADHPTFPLFKPACVMQDDTWRYACRCGTMLPTPTRATRRSVI